MKIDLTLDIITRKFIPAEVGKILRKQKENTLSTKKGSENQEKTITVKKKGKKTHSQPRKKVRIKKREGSK